MFRLSKISHMEAQCSDHETVAKTSTSFVASNFPSEGDFLWQDLRDFYSSCQQTLSLLTQIDFALAEFE